AILAQQRDSHVADGEAKMAPSGSARRPLPVHQRSYLANAESITVGLRPVRLDGVEHLPAEVGGKQLASELGAKNPDDVAGGRHDAAAGAVEREIELGHVDRAGPAGEDRVVWRQIAARALAAQRTF